MRHGNTFLDNLLAGTDLVYCPVSQGLNVKSGIRLFFFFNSFYVFLKSTSGHRPCPAHSQAYLMDAVHVNSAEISPNFVISRNVTAY